MSTVVLPAHLTSSKPSLDPYGHLLRMLMPRASGIAFHDARGTPMWVADGYDGPDPQPLVEEALHRAPPSTHAEIDGFSRDFQGSPAYVFRVRDDLGHVIAVAVLTTRDAENRPYTFVQHLVHPALECLQRELQARASVGTISRDLETRDQDLDLLLKAAPDLDGAAGEADELGSLVQACVDHLGCVLGALVVPERNVAICKSETGTKPRVDVLTRTHRHLLNWAQLQRRNLVINRTGPNAEGLPAVKILSVPVRHASSRALGFLALFRAADGADFEQRDERLCELLARKVTGILQSNYDAMTSLLTRPALESQVRAYLATHDPRGHSVLYVDVDGMQVVNDTFGMHIGDEVIGKVADVLRNRPRAGAMCARISGDRFAAFLPDCRLPQAAEVADLLRQQCADLSYQRGEGTVKVSVSIGVAELPESSPALAHGLANAELACKAAKERGRNRVELFQEGDQSVPQRQSDTAVAQRLKDALENDRFVLYAQPILPLGNAPAEPRFELLLRMLGEGGEVLPAGKFFAAAERCQMLPAIDRWVVRQALAALKSQVGALRGRAARFSINLTGPSIASDDFLSFLEQSVRDSGVPPEVLCFELTETAAASNMQRADRLMQRMRLLGCSFALDDFGTGLSSLGYLGALPVSVLKIDGSFVRDSAHNPRTESMVRAITQLARTMGMDTVAEFVETDELRMRMAGLGVDFGQGFAIGRPVPLGEILGDLALYEMLAMQPAAGAGSRGTHE
jgi:diguanylate cyclase (GGDEF)-like protein